MKALITGLITAVLLVGCGVKEKASDESGYHATVSGLRMERQETRNDSTKSTELEYATKATIEVTNAKGAKPSGVLMLKIADETGTAEGDTLPKDESILVKEGIGKVDKKFSKTVPDGQSQPIPPKYTISAAGFIPFEPAEMIVGDNAPKEASKLGLPRFQLIVEPIRVVKNEKVYNAKSLIRMKALDNVPSQPLFVFMNQKTISHPNLKPPFEDKLALTIVMNGEGTTPIDEYLGLTYTYGDGLQEIPKDAPQAPEYEFSMIGVYRMEPTKLTIK